MHLRWSCTHPIVTFYAHIDAGGWKITLTASKIAAKVGGGGGSDSREVEFSIDFSHRFTRNLLFKALKNFEVRLYYVKNYNDS